MLFAYSKTKVKISCTFAFAYAKSIFSDDTALQLILPFKQIVFILLMDLTLCALMLPIVTQCTMWRL